MIMKETNKDSDFMDELSFQRYWFETSDDLGVMETDKSIRNPYHETQQYVLGTDLCSASYHHIYEEETRNIPDSPTVYPEIEEHVEAVYLMHSESSPSPDETGGFDQTCLIQPSFSVKYKLMMVVDYLQQFAEDFDVLAQIWVPLQRGGKIVLTTNDQLYSVSTNSKYLQSFRNVSKNYQFPTEVNSRESLGLPGRAFLGKLPEWSPDVRFFESDECPRLNYAKLYSICGCLAIPVFERHGGACVAVVEIVSTVQMISYHLELESIYKALEAVDLEGSQDFHPCKIMDCNEMYQDTVPEIAEVLESLCKSTNLPLALTWGLCYSQSKSGYDQIDEKSAPSISTVRSACFITDTELLGFYKACSEQYLFLDQGIVGKAFMKRRQYFSTDITCFSKADYPLSHHAKIFGLRAALAIPLQNLHTGAIDFVLELFLPLDCQDIREQKQMWDLLSNVIEQTCRTFQVVMDKKFVGDINSELMDASNGEFSYSPPKESYSDDSYEIPPAGEARKEGESVCLSSECPEELKEEFDSMTQWYNDDNDENVYYDQVHSELGKVQQNSGAKTSVSGVDYSCVGQFRSSSSRKTGKRRAKTEKKISLQVIRRYFAENLKDAAKSIGVCPTTLKRICRQHGIARWPSRKIKKVNHSLKKLQLVVDSVQGAKGLIQIGSIYNASPQSCSQKIPCNVPLSSLEVCNKLNLQPDISPDSIDSKSQRSSSSQNHGSGLRRSTGLKQPFSTINGLYNGDTSSVQDPVAVLKQTFSTAELLQSVQRNSQSSQDYAAFRVKATFGKENIRFSMHPNWSFKNLQQEIAKRFSIDDFSRIDMKYLDSDQDAVLLNCDADLEECKELFRDFLSNTIKISLHQI